MTKCNKKKHQKYKYQKRFDNLYISKCQIKIMNSKLVYESSYFFNMSFKAYCFSNIFFLHVQMDNDVFEFFQEKEKKHIHSKKKQKNRHFYNFLLRNKP
jgi:hypothetical protein